MLEAIAVPELTDEQIAEIFSRVDPLTIPAEFIQLAKLITPKGQVMYLDGYEYRNFIDKQPTGAFIGNVELALNLDRFGQDVLTHTQLILDKEQSDYDYFSFDGGERS